jgi:hypothetical protein
MWWNDYRQGFGLVIRFIDHLYTRLGTTSNYSASANLHSSQITTAPASSFPACCVSTSRSLVTASNSWDFFSFRSQVPSEWHLPSNCPFSSQTPVQNWSGWERVREEERERKWVVVRDTTFGGGAGNYISVVFLITPRHGPRRQHRSFPYAYPLPRQCVYRVVY